MLHVNYARVRSLARLPAFVRSALHLLPLSSSGRGPGSLPSIGSSAAPEPRSSPSHFFVTFYLPSFLRGLLSSLSLIFRPIASEYSITERIPSGNRNNIDYIDRLSDTAKTCWLPTECSRASAKYENVDKTNKNFRAESRVTRLEKRARVGFLSVLDCAIVDRQ